MLLVMNEITYTAAHWGIYEVENRPGARPVIRPFVGDADPSPIGLHMADESLDRLRIRRPAIRRSVLKHGPGAKPELRGKEEFVEVGWDEALDLVAGELKRVRRDFGNRAIFGGSYGWSSAGRFHHAQSQLHRFLNMYGGYVRHVTSYSLGAAHTLLGHLVAPMSEMQALHESWDRMAEHTKLFVTFGGVPLKNAQVSSGGAGDHRVRAGLRAMAQAGTRFVNISPVRDDLETGGEIEWIPIRPNTDTAMMLGLAHAVLTDNHFDRGFLETGCVGFERFEPYLTGAVDGVPKTPAWASAITGVPEARIVALAREMLETRTMLNLAWSLQRAAHGEQPFWMLITLGSMLGQVGLPGGGFGLGYGAMNTMGSKHAKFTGPTLPQGRNGVREFIPVARITDLLLHPGESFTYDGQVHEYPDIRLVYWAGGNPFHHHQDLNRLERAWRKPETIVVQEQFWTPTAKRADIVLPATMALERNDIGSATLEGHLIAMRKAMPAFAESRDDFAIFAGLAERLGVKDAFDEGLDEMGWLRRMYEEAIGKAAYAGVAMPDFDSFWRQGVVSLAEFDKPVSMLGAFRDDPAANRLNTPSGKIEIFSEEIEGFNLPDCPGHATWMPPWEWLGDDKAKVYPLHLISDQPKNRLHGQLDHSPHSLASKVSGREPVFLNPQDAAARGIAPGELVEVFNDRGRCLAGAVLSDDIMPGVARISTGSWYDPQGGMEAHGNPNVLTMDRGASGLSQGCAAQSCLVEARRYDGPPVPVRAHVLPDFLPRDAV